MNELARYWFMAAMRCMDDGWSDATGLADRCHSEVNYVRGTAWYALGLLMRNGAGDGMRAARALEQVLANQWTDPAREEVGCYARYPAQFIDKPGLVENVDYDPNWREFIAPTLILVLEHYAERLPPPLVGRIVESVRLAALGSHRRRVWSKYTNIALLSAFLLHDAGHRFHDREWLSHGDDLARTVYTDFSAFSAFPEYNSPTYNGVQLMALALWRRHGRTPELRAMGAAMEAALWRDMAQGYHSELRNMCGPWSRAYGTDMTRYLAATGLWIATAVAQDMAPLPELTPSMLHGHDLTLMPVVALLAEPPDASTLRLLTRWEGERSIAKRIGSDPERSVTAWLSRDIMLGGEASGPVGSVYSMCNQSYPATIHWRHGREVGCVALPGRAPVDAVVRKNELHIHWYPHEGQRDGSIVFQVSGVAATPEGIGNEVWNLPGLDLHVHSNLGKPIVEWKDPILEIRYRIPGESVQDATMTINCRASEA